MLISLYRSLVRIVPHADVENKHMDTKAGKEGGTNWKIGTGVYILK